MKTLTIEASKHSKHSTPVLRGASPTLALAQARHQQAVSALADAEAELLAAMRAIDPGFTGSVEAMQDRKWESRLEGRRPLWELSVAFGVFRQAQNAERKARSAAHRAQWATPAQPAPPPKPARRSRKTKKVIFSDYVRARLAEEAEARAA